MSAGTWHHRPRTSTILWDALAVLIWVALIAAIILALCAALWAAT